MRKVWTIARAYRTRLGAFAVAGLCVLVPAFAQQQGPIQVNSQGVSISFQNTGGDATVSRGVGLSFQNTGADSTVSRGVSILFNNQGGNAVSSNGSTISFQNAQDARSGSGVTIGFTNGCVLSCTATAPTTGAIGASISFGSTSGSNAPATSCGGAVTYDWNFGDRTAHSTQPNPTHTYTAAGIYAWTLTTNVSGASACVKTGRITIGSPSEYCLTTSVPAGGGTISVSPSGTCYTPGTLVTLTANPSTGYLFNNWSGSVPSVLNQITFVMNGNKNIAASFNQSSQVVLRGIIGIWDGNRPYKLKGPLVSLQVYATQAGSSTPIPADVADSEYSFTTHPLSSGTYDLHVDLNYRDTIYNNTGLVFGCASLNPIRKSTLTITNVVMPRAIPLHIDFKPPLIMVHGINSCFQKWHHTLNDDPISQGYTGDDPAYWESYARTRGFITFTPNYDTGLSNSNSWEAMASRVIDQIRSNLIALTGDNSGQYPPWIYIAHSQGGLVGRVLTHKWDSTNRPMIRSLRRIYEMGTPNSGSFLGSLLSAGQLFLSEYKIQSEFNPSYPDFGLLSAGNVKVFAGNKWVGGSASDGVVNVYSVFDIYIRGTQFFGYFGVGQYLKLSLAGEILGYDHFEMGDPFSNSNNSRNVIFKDRILQEICQLPGQGGSPCVGLNEPTTNTSQPSLPTSNLRTITAQTRSLGANQTCLLPFNVGVTDLMIVNDFVSSGSATVDLTDPFGQVIDFGALPLTAGERGSNEFGDFFSLHNPAPGLWTLRAVAGNGGATFGLGVAENSPVGLDGSITSQTVFAGQAAHLIGQWVGDASGVTSPEITAQVTDESGAVAGSVTLYDDGAHSDDAAGDGVFGGDTPALAISERYTATFIAQGVCNGHPFTRWAESSVDVISSSHLFTGDFTDGVYDSDEDGNFDTLQETAVVAVPTIGSYLVLADLEDAQGYFIDHAVGHLQASAVGSYSISLDFKMSGVLCGQYTAPFSIKNLKLSDAASLKTLDIWTGNVATQTYNGTLFGCLAGTPVPSISNVQPVAMFPGDSKQVIINGKSFQSGAQVSFGTGVAVSSVTFGSSTTLLAQVSVAAGATPGPRDVTVTNPDGHFFSGIAFFSVASDQPPAVSINNLADQQVVNGTVTVSATASDDLGVQKVEFYVDGVLSGTDTSFPYQLVWDTGSLPNGIHTLSAKAYDTANQISSQQINVVVSCISSYAPTAQSFTATGGNGTVNVTATGGCSWTPISNAPWIMITSGGGSGSGPVGFSVDANTGPARSGTLTIAAQTFTVNQDSGCSFSLGAPGQTFGSEGGTGSVNVTCGSACLWAATSNDSWISITSNPNGSGNGSVDYSVGTNASGDPRTGTMTIAGQTFTVNQSDTPTAVKLESFIATAYDSGVFVEWQTGLEVENLGFHLYRDHGGQRMRVTPEIVAGSALIAGNKTKLTAGNSYGWFDAGGKGKQDAQYWLEDIDIDGKSTMHGPISPKRIAGLPPDQSTAALLSRVGKGEPRVSQVAADQTAPNGPSKNQRGLEWDIASGPAIKLTIKEEGWYRVTRQELLAAGLDPKTDPRNLQMYLQGQEQAMLVVGEQDGSLDQRDAIEFYATGQDVPSTDAHTYWLVSGKEPGKRISITKSEPKAGGASSFSYTIERKERTIYFSSLKNGDAENFFGRVISPQPVDQELTLQHLDQTSQADAVLEVALQGVTDLPGVDNDHQVRVTLNGAQVGRIFFDGREHKVERFAVPHGALKEGDNVVTLVAEAGPSDISLVDYVRVTYRHLYTADQDALRMTVAEQAASGASRSQTIDGFGSSSIRIFDITNPGDPQELIGRMEEQKGGRFAATVEVAGNDQRTLMAITADRIKHPVSIAANESSSWHDKANRADLLMITHRAFASSLAPLKALREKQGFSVETVDIEDLYDEFSFGEKSPQAVRDFLAYARASWQLAPRFVLFAGDASFDPRNYLGAGDFDFVPTKLIDTTYLETASDDWFVDFNDDGLPEMYVGRLPIRTSEEASVLVSKIVSYDSSIGKAAQPLRSVLLVADTNDGFDFEQASRKLGTLVSAGTNVQEIFRGRLDDATAKKQLISSINAGQSIVNYTGHGSTNVWRSLFTTEDARSLNNQQRLPLFVTMTCLNGFFQDPVMESLAEGLLKSERGGAVAVWASSALTAPSQQAVMNQQAYRLLFSGTGGLTLGEVTSKAKASVSDRDIRRTWILFGDPTMVLK